MPRPLAPLERIQKRLTYGTMPDWKTFKNNFHAPDDEDRIFTEYTLELRSRDDEIKGITKLGFYSLTDRELYRLVNRLAIRWKLNRRDSNNAGSLASSILYTLGFEWL